MRSRSCRPSVRAIFVALLLTLVVAAGCTTWSKTGMPAPADAAQDLPSMIRVHLKDGRKLTLEHASVVGDSLVGELREPSRRGHEPTSSKRVAVALADIQSVEKSRFNIATTLLILAIIVAVGAGLFVASAQNATF